MLSCRVGAHGIIRSKWIVNARYGSGKKVSQPTKALVMVGRLITVARISGGGHGCGIATQRSIMEETQCLKFIV